MFNMKSSWICIVLLVTVGLTACGSTLSSKEQRSILDHVNVIETAEYNMQYFKTSYDEFLARVGGLVGEDYIREMNAQTLYDFHGISFTGTDLLCQSETECEELRKQGIALLSELGLDRVQSTIQISNVYLNDQEQQAYVYTNKITRVNGETYSVQNKRYTFERMERNWVAVQVDREDVAYAEDNLQSLPAQTHQGQEIVYADEPLVLEGIGE